MIQPVGSVKICFVYSAIFCALKLSSPANSVNLAMAAFVLAISFLRRLTVQKPWNSLKDISSITLIAEQLPKFVLVALTYGNVLVAEIDSKVDARQSDLKSFPLLNFVEILIEEAQFSFLLVKQLVQVYSR